MWGMSFAVMQCLFRSFKMLSSDPSTIPGMLATSQIVILQVFRTNSFTHSPFSTVLFVDGHPKHLASSTQVTWLWNLENCSEPFPLPPYSLKATFNILKVFCCVCLQFKVKFVVRVDVFVQAHHFLGIPK
jgi:hypothetical protein